MNKMLSAILVCSLGLHLALGQIEDSSDPSNDQNTIEVTPLEAYGEVIPNRFSVYIKSKNIHLLYNVKNESKSANKALYIEEFYMGKMTVIRDGEKFIYDATFYNNRYFYLLYPQSTIKRFSTKRRMEAFYIENEAYFLTALRLDHMGGDSYSDSVILDERFRALTIELWVHIDYTVYKKWLELKEGDKEKTLKAIKNFYSHVIHGVNSNYRRINRPDFSLSVHLSKLFIDTNASIYTDADHKHSSARFAINDNDALDRLVKWWSKRPVSEHAVKPDVVVSFGNVDLGDVLGVAFTRGVCSKRSIAIISDASQHELISTTTHEIGHLLGAHHDDYWVNHCTSDDKFIMSANLHAFNEDSVANNFKFSPCSIAYFIIFFDFLDNDSNNCLVNEKRGEEDLHRDDGLLGQTLTLDHQCVLIFGPGSYFCGGGNPCEEMNCFKPSTSLCERKGRQTAADGSHCGNKKWCLSGECVRDDDAPAADKETCLYGDSKLPFEVNVEKVTCADIGASSSGFCYNVDVRSRCCETCPKFLRPGVKDCRFGDLDVSCEKRVFQAPSICRLEKIATRCCSSCHTLYKEADIGSFDGAKETPECKDEDHCRSVTMNCYSESFRNDCCYSCKAIRRPERKGCEYGNHLSICQGKACSPFCCNNCTDEELKDNKPFEM